MTGPVPAPEPGGREWASPVSTSPQSADRESADRETADPAAPARESADRPTRTGHPEVDAALAALERDSGLPPAEQIAGYDAAHRTLQETLATIDEGQS